MSKSPTIAPTRAPTWAPTLSSACVFEVSDSFDGSNIAVSFNLVQVAGGVSVTVTEVDSRLIGDIGGVFFHLKDYTKVTTVTGAKVTGVQLGNNSVYNLGSGINMSGGGTTRTYDIGVLIGTSGIGSGDDIQTTTFIVMGITLADIDFTQDFGVRLTSVGLPTSNRGDSSKVFGFSTCRF